MGFYNMNLKNNRYLPFIIIVVVLLLLLIVNIVTSKSKHTYTKNDIKFTYDSDTQSMVVENNVSSSTANETQEDTQLVEDTQSSVDETYYEDTQSEEDQESDEIVYDSSDTDDSDIAFEDDSESETKLFSSKEQLENIALGYLNQGRKYRKFFKSKELFEKGTNLGFDVSKLKSSDLKHNSVTFSGYYDSGDSSDILEVLVIQFKVENNKITGVTIK